MKLNYSYPIFLLCLLACITACSSGNMPKESSHEPEKIPNTDTRYVIESINSENIEINSSFDSNSNKEASATLIAYDNKLGKDLNTIIGYTEGMDRKSLAGFAAEQLAIEGNSYLENSTVDIGFINYGGIRATLNNGDILRKEIFSIFPFENKLILLPLTGKELKTLIFENNAYRIGPLYNVSVNNLTNELKVKGELVEETKIYWMSTIDYLADGNSGLVQLANLSLKDQIISPEILLRNVILKRINVLTENNMSIFYKANKYTSIK